MKNLRAASDGAYADIFKLVGVHKIKLDSKGKNMYFSKGNLWWQLKKRLIFRYCLPLVETLGVNDPFKP